MREERERWRKDTGRRGGQMDREREGRREI